MSRVNAYANFITKQRRIENNGLLRSGSSSDDGELLNEWGYMHSDTNTGHHVYVAPIIGGLVGAATGGLASLGYNLAVGTDFIPATLGTGISALVGGGLGMASGVGIGTITGNIKDRKEYKKITQYRNNVLQGYSQLEAIKAKNEHLRAVALAERKRQVEGRLHSLKNIHDVNLTRISTGNNPQDTSVRITGGPLPQGHEIVFHDNHSVSNDNEPSQFSWSHTQEKLRYNSPNGSDITPIKKEVASSTDSNLDVAVTQLNSYIQNMKR